MTTYKEAGVDIDAGTEAVSRIKKHVRSTFNSNVLTDLGGFGGCFQFPQDKYKTPVLVSSADGVGTKLKLAFLTNRHDTIGQCLVNHCTNDILAVGARPLFFLDYFAAGKLDVDIFEEVVSGLAKACKENDCALIGGETAEMPGLYQQDEYDLAGFAIGIVDNSKIVDGSEIGVGDKLIGISSSGLHSNGYSLVRKICFEILKLEIDSHVPELGKTIGEELLIPTKIYAKIIHGILQCNSILGLSHITGGGLVDNITRIIPKACNIVLNRGSWEVPPIFDFLQQTGKISDAEMMRTFNTGIGLVAVASAHGIQDILERLGAMNEKAFVIGEIIERKTTNSKIEWV